MTLAVGHNTIGKFRQHQLLQSTIQQGKQPEAPKNKTNNTRLQCRQGSHLGASKTKVSTQLQLHMTLLNNMDLQLHPLLCRKRLNTGLPQTTNMGRNQR